MCFGNDALVWTAVSATIHCAGRGDCWLKNRLQSVLYDHVVDLGWELMQATFFSEAVVLRHPGCDCARLCGGGVSCEKICVVANGICINFDDMGMYVCDAL